MLFHSTGGKDKTGIVAALFLYALGCSQTDIIDDYNASAVVYLAAVETLKAELEEQDYDIELLEGLQTTLSVIPEVISAGFYYIESHYDRSQDFLMDAIGFNSDQIRELRKKYLESYD